MELRSSACLVMGLSLPALGVIRSLGRRGIRIIAVDHVDAQVGSFSKYCKNLSCPHPLDNEKDLLHFLLELSQEVGPDCVMIPTNDSYVFFLARNVRELGDHYRFNVPDEDLVLTLNDKRLVAELAERCGVDVPRTYVPETREELSQVARDIDYPCIVKPAFGFLYGQAGAKGIVAQDREGLMKAWVRMDGIGDRRLVQEYVDGGDDLQYSCNVYFDRNGRPAATFMARKVRQNPPGTGVGSFVESCFEPDLEEIGLAFMKCVGYRGIAELEFKRDIKTGGFKLIEVNTRFWGQNSLAVRCGVDMPFLVYADACGIRVSDHFEQDRKRIKWVDLGSDLEACFGSGGYVREGALSTREFLQSYRGEKEFSVFCLDDLSPFAFGVRCLAARFWRKFKKAFKTVFARP